MPGDNLNTEKTSARDLKIEKTVEIKKEKPKKETEKVVDGQKAEPKIEVVEEPKIEVVEEPKMDKVEEPKLEVVEELKIKSENKVKLLKGVFNGIEILVKEMYDNVFSKNAQFKPTFNETLHNAMLYLGFKAKSVNCLTEFNLAFNGVDLDKISSSFVPYVIKLSTWYDKKFNKEITGKVVSEISEFFKVLVDSNEINVDINEILNFIKTQ